MTIKHYLKNPCGLLSIPYWKAKTLKTPDSIEIIHCRDWHGQCTNPQRYFRVKHSLEQLPQLDFDGDTIEIASSAGEFSEMINASYVHESIAVSEEDVLKWMQHETFRADLWICIRDDEGRMIASGIAEYDAACKEGVFEWVQVLPVHRRKGLGKKIVIALLNRLKAVGAEFVTVSGNLDNATAPLALYRVCGFTGDDVWYICKR